MRIGLHVRSLAFGATLPLTLLHCVGGPVELMLDADSSAPETSLPRDGAASDVAIDAQPASCPPYPAAFFCEDFESATLSATWGPTQIAYSKLDFVAMPVSIPPPTRAMHAKYAGGPGTGVAYLPRFGVAKANLSIDLDIYPVSMSGHPEVLQLYFGGGFKLILAVGDDVRVLEEPDGQAAKTTSLPKVVLLSQKWSHMRVDIKFPETGAADPSGKVVAYVDGLSETVTLDAKFDGFYVSKFDLSFGLTWAASGMAWDGYFDNFALTNR